MPILPQGVKYQEEPDAMWKKKRLKDRQNIIKGSQLHDEQLADQ